MFSYCGQILRTLLGEDQVDGYVGLPSNPTLVFHELTFPRLVTLIFIPSLSMSSDRNPYRLNCRRALGLLQGVGIAFGPDVTKQWCTENKVSAIIRSHEVRQGRIRRCYAPQLNCTDVPALAISLPAHLISCSSLTVVPGTRQHRWVYRRARWVVYHRKCKDFVPLYWILNYTLLAYLCALVVRFSPLRTTWIRVATWAHS